MQSEQIGELVKALSLAQSEMMGAQKNAKNPHFHSSFADLESVWNCAKGPLTKNGLAISQTTDIDLPTGRICLITTLMHTSGQWISGKLPILMGGRNDNPQAMGAGLSYARRYGLTSILNIPQVEEDDGEIAEGRGAKSTTSEVKTTVNEPRKTSTTSTNPGDYLITFGKYKDTQIKLHSVKDHKNYIAYIRKQAQEKNQPVTGKAKEYVDHAEAYIADHNTEENNNFGPPPRTDFGEINF